MASKIAKQAKIDAPWLHDPRLQAVLRAIKAAGGEGRMVGGAVRNTLMALPVSDIDIATTLLPQQVIALAKTESFAAHPTGIDHGTITLVSDGAVFEVTTLRKDVSTDGRRATVAFTLNWAEDALRRDFTINALYCDANGNIYDFTGGYRDIQKRRVRFVGRPSQRIREDYLRILRFFRFHAQYGRGNVDEAGLKACVRLRAGLAQLSAERVRQEMLKLLVAPRAVETLKLMDKSGILRKILPHAADWKTLKRLPPDGVLRLVALAKEPAALKSRFKLSNAEGQRIKRILAAPVLSPKLTAAEQRRMLYALKEDTWRDAAHLSWARSGAKLEDKAWRSLIDLPLHWVIPNLPLDGQDLQGIGISAGPKLGAVLQAVEDWWVASDFKPGKDELLGKAKLMKDQHG